MLIEPLESLTVKLPAGVRILEPGLTYNLPTLQAQKLLTQAHGRVRVVEPEILSIGTMIEFRSPLFGLCTGRVLSLEVESIRISEHSVTKEVMTIPQAWIVRTLEEV